MTVRQPPSRPSEPPSSRPLRKHQRRSIDQWHQSDLSLVARIVVIPIKHILLEWNKDENNGSPNISPDVGRQAKKLHDAMCQLRLCSTELALQKASLQVTLSLLDMLACESNPFVVMQLAVMFASQCAKGGSMDLHFKTELPPLHDCDPMQALTILARADCLQAVHFSQEATYLCSFVARCCQWHRDRLQSSSEWTSKWKVIGVYAYNLSMATRSTICATQYDKDSQSKALEIWDDEVLGELERCRSDAIAMRKAALGDDDDHDGDDGDHDGDKCREEPADDESVPLERRHDVADDEGPFYSVVTEC